MNRSEISDTSSSGCLAEIAKQPSVDGVEPRPERQPQQHRAAFRRGCGALRLRNQRSNHMVLGIEVAYGRMQVVEERVVVSEPLEQRTRLSNSVEVLLEGDGIDRLHEVVVERPPESAHGTPASRPGVQRLVVAGSGRRAPLDGEGEGRLAACRLRGRDRGRDGPVGELVQGPTTPAHAGGRKPDQVFVAACEPQMQPTLTHDPEQFAAMAAAPFLFVQGRLRRRGLRYGGNLRGRSVLGAERGCTETVLLQIPRSQLSPPAGKRTRTKRLGRG